MSVFSLIFVLYHMLLRKKILEFLLLISKLEPNMEANLQGMQGSNSPRQSNPQNNAGLPSNDNKKKKKKKRKNSFAIPKYLVFIICSF